mgnify:CR=1 FL=1
MNPKVKAKSPVRSARRGRTSTSRLSSKNQVTLPVDIVRSAGLDAGDIVNFEVKAGRIIITVQENIDHPLGELIGVGTDAFQNFDLKKERSQMWPE